MSHPTSDAELRRRQLEQIEHADRKAAERQGGSGGGNSGN